MEDPRSISGQVQAIFVLYVYYLWGNPSRIQHTLSAMGHVTFFFFIILYNYTFIFRKRKGAPSAVVAGTTLNRRKGAREAPHPGARSHERPSGHQPGTMVPLLSILE